MRVGKCELLENTSHLKHLSVKHWGVYAALEKRPRGQPVKLSFKGGEIAVSNFVAPRERDGGRLGWQEPERQRRSSELRRVEPAVGQAGSCLSLPREASQGRNYVN